MNNAKIDENIRAEFERYVSHISKMDGVLRIYLFGSYAYGEPTEFSDIDLFIVVRNGMDTLKVAQRISLDLCDRKFPVDVLVDTESDFNKLIEPDRVTIQREVNERGVLVFGEY